MSRITGDYIYNQVLKLVDYCGDIVKSDKADKVMYHQDFSPNNLRRLILSPDGAIAYFHVITPSNTKRKLTSFSSRMVQATQNLEDYVPMTNVLSADRVFSSVEEVIIISGSNTGDCYLTQRELDFSSLVRSYANQSGNLEETIKKRYKRLYAFAVYNGTLNEFLANVEKVHDSPKVLLCDQDFMQNANVHYFHKEDWYKGYGSSANHYVLDAEGSKLNLHFKSLIQEFTEAEKKSKLDEYKKERLGEVGKTFTEHLDRYKGMQACVKRLMGIQANGMNAWGMLLDLPDPKIELASTSLLDESTKDVIVKKSAGSETELVNQNIKVLKQAYDTYYIKILDNFLTVLDRMSYTYPLTVKVMLNDCDRAILIPESLKAKTKHIEEMGFTFRGTRLTDSLANICMLWCQFFASSHGIKPLDNKYKTKEYWLEVIKC